MLAWLEAVSLRLFLAEMKEMADLTAELGKVAVIFNLQFGASGHFHESNAPPLLRASHSSAEGGFQGIPADGDTNGTGACESQLPRRDCEVNRPALIRAERNALEACEGTQRYRPLSARSSQIEFDNFLARNRTRVLNFGGD